MWEALQLRIMGACEESETIGKDLKPAEGALAVH